MADKALAEQILAMEPQVVDRPVGPREAWEAARNQAAALADAATPTGWVIANSNNNRWRCVWEWESNVEWTDDITQALKFATREDAERYAKEDEDAWLIYQVGVSTNTTPVVVGEQAGDVRQAVRVRELVWTDEEYPGECWSAHPYDIWRENDGYHLLYWSITHGDPYPTLEAAQGYAYSHKVAMIKKEIEPDPTPALAEALRLPEVQAVREAVSAALANADRPGSRMGLNMGANGEDIWIYYQEVDQSCLDQLTAALAKIGGAA